MIWRPSGPGKLSDPERRAAEECDRLRTENSRLRAALAAWQQWAASFADADLQKARRLTLEINPRSQPR